MLPIGVEANTVVTLTPVFKSAVVSVADFENCRDGWFFFSVFIVPLICVWIGPAAWGIHYSCVMVSGYLTIMIVTVRYFVDMDKLVCR